tara:strand:- start:775 stop:1389 length:615 start_codon:yes stop_codon:yes gene_type:complete
MSFRKNKYEVIKKAISSEIAGMAFNYLLLKQQVAESFFRTRYISPYEEIFGTWGDRQVPETFSIYGDVLMEILLCALKPKMEKITDLKLIETYAYARVYKTGDILKKHTDRFSCEISTTLNLGGDKWPIYLKDGKKDKKIILSPGDMLVYKGNILEHWRDAFDGKDCGQVFLHYNDLKTKGALKNAYDSRPHLGLPAAFKQNGK